MPLGIACQCPEESYVRIAPRSSMSWKKSADVGARVVDQDYRGEVIFLLCSHGRDPVEIKVGDRVAQLIVEKIYDPLVEVV